jgi:hypothetical protein
MMYFVMKQHTAAHLIITHQGLSKMSTLYWCRPSLLPQFTGPSIFSTGPQRNIPGTICYDIIAVAHFTVVCDTGTVNLPNRLLDIKN